MEQAAGSVEREWEMTNEPKSEQTDGICRFAAGTND
jgi:hypothetical protein